LLPLLLAADTPKVAPERLAKQLLELEVRETALRELEQDLNQKIQTLEELRQQTLAVILPGEKERQGQLDTLIKFYQAMKPQSAARLLEKLPTPLAADVLSSMKSRGAGKILNVMNADKAVQISKLMAGQKK
jgi:flagellar motility protein MotE (MotC chaperone)